MPVITMKAAPAANTPFLKVWHEGALSPIRSRYLVWYAFLTEPASRHEAAMINVTQLVMNKQIAHDLDPVGLIAFPQHRHLVTTIMITWLATRMNNDPTPRPVAMSESYSQYFLPALSSLNEACQTNK